MSPSAVVAVIGVAFVVGILYYRQRRRVVGFRAFAAKLGFTYIGTALPRSLSLKGTELASCSSVWNVIDGEPNGIRVIVFHCQIGQGKGNWRRTVVAVHSPAVKVNPTIFKPAMTVEDVGG